MKEKNVKRERGTKAKNVKIKGEGPVVPMGGGEPLGPGTPRRWGEGGRQGGPGAQWVPTPTPRPPHGHNGPRPSQFLHFLTPFLLFFTPLKSYILSLFE